MPMNAILTKQIRSGLEERGWSVRELERKAGLKERAVLSILQGKSKHPRIDTLVKIANALDTSVSSLIGEKKSISSNVDLDSLVFDLVLDFIRWSRDSGNRFPTTLSDADCEYIADAITTYLFGPTSDVRELHQILDESHDRAARVSSRRTR